MLFYQSFEKGCAVEENVNRTSIELLYPGDDKNWILQLDSNGSPSLSDAPTLYANKFVPLTRKCDVQRIAKQIGEDYFLEKNNRLQVLACGKTLSILLEIAKAAEHFCGYQDAHSRGHRKSNPRGCKKINSL